MGWSAAVERWILIATYLPIVAISVLGFSVFLAKAWQYRHPAIWRPPTRDEVFAALAAGDRGRALQAVGEDRALASQMLRLLDGAGRSRARLRERAVDAGSGLARQLESGLDGLALIATLGPLFGLFGTVVGIVLVFERLSAGTGVASPRELAGGIGTALYTTILGLIVGVSAVVSHWYLRHRLDRQLAALETVAADLVDRLAEED
jgi:biopolymer transport protein ExbB